jgi:hypothetical protein
MSELLVFYEFINYKDKIPIQEIHTAPNIIVNCCCIDTLWAKNFFSDFQGLKTFYDGRGSLPSKMILRPSNNRMFYIKLSLILHKGGLDQDY